jgi:hypothetical protein
MRDDCSGAELRLRAGGQAVRDDAPFGRAPCGRRVMKCVAPVCLALGWGLAWSLGGPVVVAAEPAAAGVVEVEAVYVLDEQRLPLPAGIDPDRAGRYRLGGFSDLVALPDPQHPGHRFLAITDRGPNAELVVESPLGDQPRRLRTLPVPDFSPVLVELRLVGGPHGAAHGTPSGPPRGSRRAAPRDPAHAAEARPGRIEVTATRSLRTATGRPLSGRPVAPQPGDAPVFEPKSGLPLPPDPNGFDTEGLARLPDGSLWVAEEYLPSLGKLSGDGRVVERFVPEAMGDLPADTAVRHALPAALAQRRENRGFEALAASPDGRRLYALMQSPAAGDGEAAIEASLVEFDPRAGETVAEHRYRLGDPADTDTTAIAAADGKLSALAMVDARTLLVVEQSATESRIYRVALPAAGDAAATLAKTLVADLLPLVPRLARDIAPAAPPPERPAELKPADLKIEGLAVLGDGRVAIVNDNDFDIAAGDDAASAARRTCLWVLRLPSP